MRPPASRQLSAAVATLASLMALLSISLAWPGAAWLEKSLGFADFGSALPAGTRFAMTFGRWSLSAIGVAGGATAIWPFVRGRESWLGLLALTVETVAFALFLVAVCWPINEIEYLTR